jgi:hypothetical protein
MLTRIRDRAAPQAIIVLVAMAVTVSAPSAFAFYRCQMMGTTMASPCCGDDEDGSSSQGLQLDAERCCTKVSVALERAPSELTPRDRQLLPPLAAAAVAVRLTVSLPVSTPLAWTRAQFDSGPPIILRVCSLLI